MVIAGDYKGTLVSSTASLLKMERKIQIGPAIKPQRINRETVESYEVLNEISQVSSVSAAGRAALGSVFFGPAGMAAGLGARKKGTYWVAIQFKNGKRSLLEVNERLLRDITIALF